ncbi:MAG: hypothetical protein IJW49_05475 [Clostridia bacterium]|nr:hypothetical protein [Clostridia bacterium]
MNDEKADTMDQTTPPQDHQDPSSDSRAEDAGDTDRVTLANQDETVDLSDPCISCEDPAEAQKLPEDPLQDPDPASSVACEGDPQSGLEQLRGELTRLRAELAQKEILWERIGEECDEFQTLYPNVALKDLSDRVWEDVGRGIPIAAAYALAEKRRLYTEAQAEKSNYENRLRSAGSLAGTENDYFSPAEVRAMTSHEVHENYQKIMRSMQKWH